MLFLVLLTKVPKSWRNTKVPPALDAGLLSVAQAVEHYEISRYGILRTWALELGYEEAAEILHSTLEEAKTADLSLTTIATSVVNRKSER
jgi:ferritin-like metal-binding protein YciE